MSNSDRIAHAAAEAEAKSNDKAAKKAATAAAKAAKAAAKAAAPKKAPAPRKPRAPKVPPRMKIVWGVGPLGGEAVATYPYRERAAADSEVAKKGKSWVVTALKVVMEDEPKT